MKESKNISGLRRPLTHEQYVDVTMYLQQTAEQNKNLPISKIAKKASTHFNYPVSEYSVRNICRKRKLPFVARSTKLDASLRKNKLRELARIVRNIAISMDYEESADLVILRYLAKGRSSGSLQPKNSKRVSMTTFGKLAQIVSNLSEALGYQVAKDKRELDRLINLAVSGSDELRNENPVNQPELPFEEDSEAPQLENTFHPFSPHLGPER